MAYFKINIESWESYNNGYLLGKWHDVSEMDECEFSELLESISEAQAKQLNKLLKWENSQCEELFAPDIETDMPITYVESGLNEMFEQYLELKELMENESEETVKLAQAINSDFGMNDISEALEKARSAIELSSSSEDRINYDLGHYMMEMTGDLNQLPDFAQRYFDFEAFGRDLILGGDYSIFKIDGTSYAVDNH